MIEEKSPKRLEHHECVTEPRNSIESMLLWQRRLKNRPYKMLSYDKNANLHKCIVNVSSRTSTDLADVSSSGRAFHRFGIAQVKDSSPRVAFDLKQG